MLSLQCLIKKKNEIVMHSRFMKVSILNDIIIY